MKTRTFSCHDTHPFYFWMGFWKLKHTKYRLLVRECDVEGGSSFTRTVNFINIFSSWTLSHCTSCSQGLRKGIPGVEQPLQFAQSVYKHKICLGRQWEMGHHAQAQNDKFHLIEMWNVWKCITHFEDKLPRDCQGVDFFHAKMIQIRMLYGAFLC